MVETWPYHPAIAPGLAEGQAFHSRFQQLSGGHVVEGVHHQIMTFYDLQQVSPSEFRNGMNGYIGIDLLILSFAASALLFPMMSSEERSCLFILVSSNTSRQLR
jgi:hypothetical protein